MDEHGFDFNVLGAYVTEKIWDYKSHEKYSFKPIFTVLLPLKLKMPVADTDFFSVFERFAVGDFEKKHCPNLRTRYLNAFIQL